MTEADFTRHISLNQSQHSTLLALAVTALVIRGAERCTWKQLCVTLLQDIQIDRASECHLQESMVCRENRLEGRTGELLSINMEEEMERGERREM